MEATYFIGNRRREVLNNRCQEYKSKYEQIEAKWKYKYILQQQKYVKEIESLKQQIFDQNSQLNCMADELTIAHRQIGDANIKHQKQIKSHRKQLKKQQKLKKKIFMLEHENVQKENKIQQLQNECFAQQNGSNPKPMEYKPYFSSPLPMEVNVSWNSSTLPNIKLQMKSISTQLNKVSNALPNKQTKIKSYKPRNKFERMSIQRNACPILQDILMGTVQGSKSPSDSLDYCDQMNATPLLYQSCSVKFRPSLRNSYTLSVREELISTQ